MQPNNQNPYYPPRDPAASAVSPVGGGQQVPPAFSGLPKSGPQWGWIITVVVLSLLAVGLAGFAIWAFGERQDYKNNSDQKSAAAVEVAKKQQVEEDNLRFAEELKNPLKTYVGPDSYGSVSVQYPKTWSAYVSTTGTSGGSAVDAYFHPDIVPSVTAGGTGKPAVALRVQIVNQAYNQVVSGRNSNIATGGVTATPYAFPKMPEQIGMKYVGKLSEQLNGTEVIVPIRDKTLIVTTDTDQFLPDFDKYILPNITFEP